MMKTMVIWLVVFRPTPLKNHGVKVSWDHEIPNIVWKNNPNVPNHQPDTRLYTVIVIHIVYTYYIINPTFQQVIRQLSYRLGASPSS